MARFINPAPQYFLNDGKPNNGGTVQYFNSGTNIPLDTFADSLMTIKNTNPVILDGAGRLPNVFFQGSARVIVRGLILGELTIISEDDPVGGEQVTGEFALWDALITYITKSIVKGSDDEFYISLVNPNINNNPTAPSPSNWSKIEFLGVYNASQTYSIGDVVQETDGKLWASQINSNLNNLPNTDSGTNWIPAVTGSKIAEVITLETRTTTALQLTGGGSLIALRLNQVQSTDTWSLPMASSVETGQDLVVELTSKFAAFQPTIQRTGADTISFSGGTDTDLLMDSGSQSIRFTSDGVSDWELSL